MNTPLSKPIIKEDVIFSLNILLQELQSISPDDIMAFSDWYKRLGRVCHMAGERPYGIYRSFGKRHLGPVILGESYTRDEILGILNDAPNCIQDIINAVEKYGIVPIKSKSTSRRTTKSTKPKNGLKPLRYISY